MTEDNPYFNIGEINGRTVVVAKRSHFAAAISDGCLPFDVEEMNLMKAQGYKMDGRSLIIMVKAAFPKSKLESITCRKRN